MNILGYKPYHMYECAGVQGPPHMKTLEEAVIAQHNRLSGYRKYERPDFDRWLGDYDVRTPLPPGETDPPLRKGCLESNLMSPMSDKMSS